ncbi:MAG TPA: thiamine pyrophosphate-binding protein [Longimicrobiales bacterium]|nr:thiamine pyrophosphate-binding protein [Longimicrobiales bacterium]
MTVSEYLIRRMREFGIDHVFAVPGDYAGPFLATVDATRAVTRVGTTNELVAGYAADGYARVRGAGAACVTYGVGTFCALNGLAGSYVEQVPVLLIVGSPSRKNRRIERTEGVLYHHSTGRMTADSDSVQNVVVAREVISSARKAPRQIDRAIGEAMRWRRPAYIEVWQDVWSKECAAPDGPLVPKPLPLNERALDRAVEQAMTRLRRAHTPVLWAGLEIQRHGLQGALKKMLRSTGLSYATDLIGKGVIAETTKGFVGVYDGASASEHVRTLLETSDCVLGLGNLVTDDFLDLIQKNYDNMVLAWNNTVRVGRVTHNRVPITLFVERLLERMQEEGYRAPGAARPRLEGMRNARRERRMLLSKAVADAAPPGQVTYDAFFQRMREWVDADMVLLADTTIALYSAAELPIYRHDGFIAQAAWNSIGYTPGAALGAACGDPAGRRPVVFVGDGGFQMSAQALSDIVRIGRGAVVCIFNNALYGIEQAFVDVSFYTEGGAPDPFCVLHGWDYAKLVDLFGGGWAATVHTVEQLDAALATAKANSDMLSILDLRIPERDITPQMLALAQPPA